MDCFRQGPSRRKTTPARDANLSGFLLECLASGMSVVVEIVDAYPTLSEDAVQGALRELAHGKEAAVA